MIKDETPEDRKINVSEVKELNYWCEELNLRAEDLKDIIIKVGPAVHDVKLYMAKKLLISWPETY
jgi:hypothetical protein